jgi:ribosomal subunit interface protein
MRVQVAGRRLDLGASLKARIGEELSRSVDKFFNRPGEAVVTVSRDGVGFEVDCSLHLDSGMVLQSEGRGGDAHSAFEVALDKMEKRVRRYKRRLRNHHNTQKTPLPAENAVSYVLQSTEAEDWDEAEDFNGDDSAETVLADGAEAAPLVIAETTVQMRTMTVSMAVLQLDLSEAPALLFRNAGHGGLNLVYRRKDGNVGWVDPQRANGVAR